MNMTFENMDILNTKDLAEMLSVSISWVRKAVATRTIPFYKPNKKTLYFRRSEVEDWVFRNRISTMDEMMVINETKSKLKRR